MRDRAAGGAGCICGCWRGKPRKFCSLAVPAALGPRAAEVARRGNWPSRPGSSPRIRQRFPLAQVRLQVSHYRAELADLRREVGQPRVR